jgi:O-acetyl-ADP-ribose deacetylase (regulator of RNase III)
MGNQMATEIQYITGDATAPKEPGNKIIVHICNDIGGWGKGFVLAISKRWKEPEVAYRKWYSERQTSDFALGSVQFVQAESDTIVANLIGQHDLKRKGATGAPPIRYDAVAAGLTKVAMEAKRLNATVHMPRIGCGLAGGNWEMIEPILFKTLCAEDIRVFVYDLG